MEIADACGVLYLVLTAGGTKVPNINVKQANKSKIAKFRNYGRNTSKKYGRRERRGDGIRWGKGVLIISIFRFVLSYTYM